MGEDPDEDDISPDGGYDMDEDQVSERALGHSKGRLFLIFLSFLSQRFPLYQEVFLHYYTIFCTSRHHSGEVHNSARVSEPDLFGSELISRIGIRPWFQWFVHKIVKLTVLPDF